VKQFLIIAALIAALILIPVVAMKTAKGVNNPGNIRNSTSKFTGETTKEGDAFKSFSSPAYGYRAMIVLLKNYYNKGFTTVRSIINRYAPSSENPSSSYISFVSSALGVSPDADVHDIIFSDNIKNLLTPMTKFEQGKSFTVNPDHITQALNLA
jgi:hypothetical protein